MLAEREDNIFETLDKLNESQADFVVVGGYAVSGLARHRFSVDCDIVLPKNYLGKIEAILIHEGFKENIRQSGFDKVYGGEFVNYVKKIDELPITIDLLVNGLTSRQTEATWGFDYIIKNSTETIITGSQRAIKCRTPTKELMLAMKMHSARRTDIRDIVMLAGNADGQRTLEHLKRGDIEKLKNKLKNIIHLLGDKNFPDSVKGVFTVQKKVDKEIKTAKVFIEFMCENLETP